jgi:predicted GNAT superfamily acetyltransferase
LRNVTLDDGTVIRALASHAERAEAVRLQEETWGAGFSEKIPAAMLLVAEETGGVAGAAFEPGGRMLGFIFGVTGVRDGTLIHWSDILAVRKDAQGKRLGEAMKRWQRDRCRAIGVERMYWTYDPFVAKNAHLNLNILGARVDKFVPDMYGTATNSPVHGSLGTDRFVALWPVKDEPVPMPSDPQLLEGAPVVASRAGGSAELPAVNRVAVHVPPSSGGISRWPGRGAWLRAARSATISRTGIALRRSCRAAGVTRRICFHPEWICRDPCRPDHPAGDSPSAEGTVPHFLGRNPGAADPPPRVARRERSNRLERVRRG